MQNCETCYQFKLPSCNGKLYIKTGIASFEDYFWKITDKFGTTYSGENIAAYGGADDLAIDIEAAPFPKGMFQPFSGAYTVEIIDVYDQIQTMTFGGKQYNCISLEFFEHHGTEIANLIQ